MSLAGVHHLPRVCLVGRPGVRSATALSGTVGLGLTAVRAYAARWCAPYRPVLERVQARLPAQSKIPAPLRVGFVTDTHLGPVVRPCDVERAMDLLCAAEPDLLLFGGDYVCESPRHAPDAVAVLANYASEARYGALAVLGNHDYSNDAPRLTALFERRGVRVLVNHSAEIAIESGTLWVIGIDDAILGDPNPDAAFADMPDGKSGLALWHEPDWAAETARRGAFLQLSGHSHGGQVRLPFVGPLAAPTGGRRYVAGWGSAAGMPVYTSRGVGVYRPPVRIRCPPEVTLLTLV